MNKFTIKKSFAISAGAGSGKTYTLSRRYINAYLGYDFFVSDNEKAEVEFSEKDKFAAEIDEIVTMTFTNAAASEMKERIFSLMKSIVSTIEGNEKEKKKNQLEFIDKLSNDEKNYIKSRLKEGLTQINDAIITTIHGFSLMMIKRYADYLKINIEDIIDELEQEELFFKSFNESLKENKDLIADILEDLSLYKITTYSKKYVFNPKFKEGIDNFEDIKDLHKLYIDLHKDNIKKILKKQEYMDYIDELASGNNITFLQYLKSINIKSKDFFDENEKEIADKTTKKLRKDIEPVNEEYEQKFLIHINNLKKFLQSVYDNYHKNLGNKLDFNKIIQNLHKLLEVKDIKLKYVMVDEFQDSNTIQYEIAKKISKNLFIVGDEKQAIYAFQGGEIEVFKRAKDELKIIEPLSENRRSDKKIIEFVNEKFNKLFEKKDLIVDNDFCASYESLEAVSEEDGEIAVLFTEAEKNENEVQIEAENIAKFIQLVVNGNVYPHIKEKYIDKGEKAIGVIYDSKTHMHYLKTELEKLGIPAKINGVEEFWDEEEIKDIMAVLKVRQIINKDELINTDKFFITGALNGKIYNKTDKEIKELLNNEEKLKEIFKFDEEVLHKFIRKIFISSGAYKRYDNPNAAKANIEELIKEVINLEEKYNYDERAILEILEKNFFNADKRIAKYDSEIANSVELSSIHYTKGLDYPIIILAQAHKNLKPNRQDGVIDTKYSIDGKEKYLIGFKIDEYKPLAYRISDFIDRLKFYEEKKRLLYVALTRAKHNIVISTAKKPPENSYAKWLDVDKLKEVKLINSDSDKKEEIILIDCFEGEFIENIEIPSFNEKANLGTAVHKIIELYHDDLSNEKIRKICDVYAVEFDEVKKMIEKFQKSEVYKELKRAKYKEFEWEFEDEEGFGRIDLWYEIGGVCKVVDFKTGKEWDYSKQLERYKKALEKHGFKEIEGVLLFLGENNG
ncbi:UvrD-helicase domain-containing protein [Nautilia lithotrophica]